MNYNANPLDQIKNFFRNGTIFSKLILINLIVWLAVQIAHVFFNLYREPSELTDALVLRYFAVPAYIPGLMARPWTIFTYMFLHIDFWHIVFNMLWLFWFGKIFLQFLSQKKLLLTYIMGGISGALLYIFAYNFFPLFEIALPVSIALGASASVMAIVTAISFYVPEYSIQLLFIGRIKIIYMAIILFVFDFFAISGANSGGHIAHIGGALWGFSYIFLMKGGKRPYAGGNRFGFIRSLSDLFGKRKMRATYNAGTHARPMSDDEYNAAKLSDQKRIDKILEKISKGGYESLTREEKEILFKSSGKKN